MSESKPKIKKQARSNPIRSSARYDNDELKNKEEFKTVMQAIKNKEALNVLNHKNKTLKTNTELAKNLQHQYIMEYAEKLSEKLKNKHTKHDSVFVTNPIRLTRTRSKTVTRDMSKSKSNYKSRKWWPFY